MKTALIAILLCLSISLSALSQTTITGHLLGCDGRPMAMSHVHLDGGLGRFNIDGEINDVNFERVQTERDGSFKISTLSTGSFYLAFTGVGHMMTQVQLVLEGPTHLQVEVRLSASQYSDNLNSVEVFFNEFDGRPSFKGKQYKMEKQSDGSYVGEIQTNLKSLSYVLANIGWTSKTGAPLVSGTMADTYEYWDYGIYFCVIHPDNNLARILFDPAKLKRSEAVEKIRFTDSTCLQARFADLQASFDRMKGDHDRAFREHFESGKTYKDFSYDWTPIAGGLRSRIKNETVQLLRDELILEYLELASISSKGIDRTFLKSQLREVSAHSQAWVYHVTAAEHLQTYAAGGTKYLERILTEHPNRNFRAQLALVLCTNAMTEHRQAEYLSLFKRLINDFPDTPAGRAAKDRFYPRGKIKPGADIPDFSFVPLGNPPIRLTNNDLPERSLIPLDNSSNKLTKSDFRGKYLLIDFWATWCGPCVGELKYLHKAFETYHGNGLEILSISFDTSPDIVQRFRSTKWPMPWHHVVVDQKDQPDISFAFEVAFPRPILVDPKGRIVEVDDKLRGDELEKTLMKYLGAKR